MTFIDSNTLVYIVSFVDYRTRRRLSVASRGFNRIVSRGRAEGSFDKGVPVLLMIGGKALNDFGSAFDRASVISFDVHYKRWRNEGPVMFPAHGAAATMCSGSLWLTGGASKQCRLKAMSRVDKCNEAILLGNVKRMPVPSAWEVGTSMPSARCHHRVVAYGPANGMGWGCQLWALGGSSLREHIGRCVHCYDPDEDRWSPGPLMNVSRCNFGAAVLDGQIYVVGGKGAAADSAEVYNGTAWEVLAGPATKRWGHGCCNFEGKIYVAGGNGELGPLRTVEAFERGSWSEERPLAMLEGEVSLFQIEGIMYAAGVLGKRVVVEAYSSIHEEWQVFSEMQLEDRLSKPTFVVEWR